jgi:RNA polymerase sigma-70 factor (ECF subfamily)
LHRGRRLLRELLRDYAVGRGVSGAVPETEGAS